MSDPQALQLTIQAGQLLAILAFGAKLVRSHARMEMRVDMLWNWFRREHEIGDGE